MTYTDSPGELRVYRFSRWWSAVLRLMPGVLLVPLAAVLTYPYPRVLLSCIAALTGLLLIGSVTLVLGRSRHPTLIHLSSDQLEAVWPDHSVACDIESLTVRNAKDRNAFEGLFGEECHEIFNDIARFRLSHELIRRSDLLDRLAASGADVDLGKGDSDRP